METKEICLREIVYHIIRNGKKIVRGVLIGALIMAVGSFGLYVFRYTNKSEHEQRLAEYEEDMVQYEQDHEALKQTAEKHAQEYTEITQYIENSYRLAINSAAVTKGSVVFAFSSDKAAEKAEAYLQSEEALQKLNSALGDLAAGKDSETLADLLSVSEDTEKAQITVSFCCESLSFGNRLQNALEELITKTESSVKVTKSTLTEAPDAELEKEKQVWDELQSESYDLMSEAQSALAVCEDNKPTEPAFGWGSLMLLVLRYLLIGALTGLLLGAIWYMCVALLSRKILSPAPFLGQNGTAVLFVAGEKKADCFEQLAGRLFGNGGKEISPEEERKTAEATIRLLSKSSPALVTDIENADTLNAARSLWSSVEGITECGRILKESKAVEKLSACDQALLLVKEGESTKDGCERILKILEASGKKLNGIIYIKK